MLKTILSISGKPGLYKLVSKGRNMLIVESITPDKRRSPVYGNEKVISLGDIAMFTDSDEVPLKKVLNTMKEKENGAVATIDPKIATKEELFAYMNELLPNFDRGRVYLSDIKKLVSWYNILITNGITDFEEEETKEGEEETEKVVADDSEKTAE